MICQSMKAHFIMSKNVFSWVDKQAIHFGVSFMEKPDFV